MKITLVNPPYPPNAHAHPPFIPLGIAYLGAVAEKAGHEVTVIDCQAERLTYDTFRSRIAQVPSDIVGVTSTTLLYNSAKELLTIAKEAHPNAITMIGGSHASFWDENALQECPALDVVVRREGEMTFLEILQRIEAKKDFSGVLGTTFRATDGKISPQRRQTLHCKTWTPCLSQHTTCCLWNRSTAWAKPSSHSPQAVDASNGVTSAAPYACSAEDTACAAPKTSSTKSKCSTKNTAKANSPSTTTPSQSTANTS